MKPFLIAGVASCALAALALAADKPETVPLKDIKDKIGYSIGLDIGKNMKRSGVEVTVESLALGLRDALSGAKPRLTDEEMQAAMETLQQTLAAKRQALATAEADDAKKAGDKNKKDGDAWLAANKKKEGVKTTASGLQYKVIKDGTGKTPKASDTVTTHYRGTLIDGTEFESSYKQNEPTSFPVNRVIAGWTEALQLMKEGAKWQLYIPSELAYGARGTPGGPIGPNSTLIFDIELIKVQAGQ